MCMGEGGREGERERERERFMRAKCTETYALVNLRVALTLGEKRAHSHCSERDTSHFCLSW